MAEFITNEPVILPSGDVSITFIILDGDFTFTDAMVMPKSLYELMTSDDIQIEGYRRMQEYINFINTPVIEDLVNG